MIGWPTVRLGDHIRVKHGFAFQGAYFTDDGHYIVLTPGNFIESGGFKPKSGAEKYYSAAPQSEFILQRGDLVIAMTEQAQGLLGSSALIPADDTYLHNQRIGLVEQCSRGTDRRFLYYLFNSRDVRTQIQATATGAKVRHTAPKRVENITVQLPPLSTQRKIAAILSAYDDLIDNNNRRIGLLEEMAQRVFREWFVDFRYPGHQDVPLVDSTLGQIPAGWSAGRWGQYATLDYGRALRGYKKDTGQYPVFGTIGQIGWCDKALFPPGVIVGRKGAYRGIRLSTSPCWVIDTAFYLRLGENVLFDSMYAYHQLRTIDLDEIDSGSAIPSTSRDAFYAIPIVVPPDYLVRRFSLLAGELDTCQRLLAKETDNLHATRDLLLPLLISGKIDVTDLDIDVPEAAA
jgi:type I restriction enzyme, S subunit